MPLYRLENVIQPYAWGSTTAIAELLGLPGPHDHPQAELWMGTHPKGPSRAVVADDRIPLHQLIEKQPLDILGDEGIRRFGPVLPYLFKVLAAARPLSIQAHPSKQEAAAGFARENREGKALNAPDRNYRDDNHKPEIICALTPFWALNGFRPAAAAADLLAPVWPGELETIRRRLEKDRAEGIGTFFKAVMTLAADKRRAACREIAARAAELADRSPVYHWMAELSQAYPADMGIISPAMLNLIRLAPQQAMYLPAGQLHAYLDGVGIELMANSDNVLRGGLTSKHVDVPELLRVVRFVETSIELIEEVAVSPSEVAYPCPAEEFALSIIRPAEGQPYVSPTERSVEILLCTFGDGRIESPAGGPMHLKKGDSLLIPAGHAPYTIHGDITLYKAAVPLPCQ